MQKRRAVYIAIIAMVLCQSVLGTSTVGETYDYVTSVLVQDDNYLVISVWTTGTGRGYRPSQGSACANSAYGRSKYPMTDERTKAWMRIALASMVTRTRIHILTDGCSQLPHSGGSVVEIVGVAACRGDDARCP